MIKCEVHCDPRHCDSSLIIESYNIVGVAASASTGVVIPSFSLISLLWWPIFL